MQPAAGDIEGFSSGIFSHKRGRTSAIRLAPLFDRGTLAGRVGKLKRARRDHWAVNRKTGSYTAHRHPIEPAEGIEAQRFFAAARRAGRRVLLARIDRGI